MERKWTGPIPDPHEYHNANASRADVYFYYEAGTGKAVSRVEDHIHYSSAITFISEPLTFAGPDHVAKAKAHVEKAWAEKDAGAHAREERKRMREGRKRDLRVGGIGRD